MPLHVPVSKSEIAELSAEEVWQYVERILTNLSNARAARIDNLDVLLSTRLPTTTFNSRLSTVRAARIDEITAARLGELDPANIPAYILTRLSLADFNAEMALIKNMGGTSGYDREDGSLEAIGAEAHHSTHIFPEDTDDTVTFTAGGADNTFGAWTEIIDNNAVTFSSKITHPTHLTAFLIEDVNVKEKVYLFEIAYGNDKIMVARYRFLAGETTKLPAVQQVRIRSDHIPPSETVYYRMKCEDGGKTCQLHIRYYQHT